MRTFRDCGREGHDFAFGQSDGMWLCHPCAGLPHHIPEPGVKRDIPPVDSDKCAHCHGRQGIMAPFLTSTKPKYIWLHHECHAGFFGREE